jgi:ATP-dependent DNA helicase RecQ
VRLLRYFGEASGPCGNCDNCREPPETWDATEAARKALSCIYRFAQHGNQRFGVGHLIDVLRGKETEKVLDFRHQQLSTFGVGRDLSEAEWRAVVRQLIARGDVAVEGDFSTLVLCAGARAVLRGEVPIQLRKTVKRAKKRSRRESQGPRASSGAAATPALPLSGPELARFQALKTWRQGVARSHNVPAYVVFHDATLAEMARKPPRTLDDLAGVTGVGAKKREAYGADILAVLGEHG